MKPPLMIKRIRLIWLNRHFRRMVNAMLAQVWMYQKCLEKDPAEEDAEFYRVEIKHLTDELHSYGITPEFRGYKFLRWN